MKSSIFQKIYQDVYQLISDDKSGHGMDHIDRVLGLAQSFAELENADLEIVSLAALLHDVDDYKLFRQESADKLINARTILEKYNINSDTKSKIIEIIRTIGYNKYLEGIRPDTLEGKIVSDADMCDAIGSMGILRTHTYTLSKGNEFFDKTLSPEELVDVEAYKLDKKSHSVQHFFDKLLKIPSILMTEAGQNEGTKRQLIMIDFLRELFREENATEWLRYLDDFESYK